VVICLVKVATSRSPRYDFIRYEQEEKEKLQKSIEMERIDRQKRTADLGSREFVMSRTNLPIHTIRLYGTKEKDGSVGLGLMDPFSSSN